MFVAEGMVFSEKDPISSATISLCLSNRGRISQLWSRATHNDGHKKNVAQRMVLSEEDPISPATISLFLSNQGRKSQLWSRATRNVGPKKSQRGVNEMQHDPENNSSVKDEPLKKTSMTKLMGSNNHVCS